MALDVLPDKESLKGFEFAEKGEVRYIGKSYGNRAELLEMADSHGAHNLDKLALKALNFLTSSYKLSENPNQGIKFIVQNIGEMKKAGNIQAPDLAAVTSTFAEGVNNAAQNGDLILHISSIYLDEKTMWDVTNTLGMIKANDPATRAVVNAIENPLCNYTHFNISNLLPTKASVSQNINSNRLAKGTLAKIFGKVFPFPTYLANSISFNIANELTLPKEYIAMQFANPHFAPLYQSMRTTLGDYTALLPDLKLE